jgi:DNA-directed RNA polymerase beta' subunit
MTFNKKNLQVWGSRFIGVANFTLILLKYLEQVDINGLYLAIPSGIAMVIMFIISKTKNINEFLNELREKVSPEEFETISNIMTNTTTNNEPIKNEIPTTINNRSVKIKAPQNITPKTQDNDTPQETPRYPYNVYYDENGNIVAVEPVE